MKKLLWLSLILNIALAATAIYLVQTRPAVSPESRNVVPVSPKAQAAAVAATKNTVAAPGTSSATNSRVDWRAVESDDYKKYIANLRSIGCPEETIRDIITADVNKLFESRRKAIFGSTNKFEYWKSGNMFAGMFDETKIEKSKQLNEEKRALLKALLGTDVPEKPDMLMGMNPFDNVLDFLPESSRTQLMELEQTYAAKLMKAMKNGSPDFEQMRKLQAEKDAEILKFLSPEQKLEYELRMSQTAMVMKMQMAGFEPTEQEFRDMFKLRKQFDDEFGLAGMAATDKADVDRRQEAQRALDDKMRALLGDERYDEYKRAQSPTYQALSRVVEKEGLSSDVAANVYGMKKTAEEAAAALANDRTLTPAERQEALRKIREETRIHVLEALGPDAYNTYVRQQGAGWVTNANPPKKK
jgi:hypothetical protein